MNEIPKFDIVESFDTVSIMKKIILPLIFGMGTMPIYSFGAPDWEKADLNIQRLDVSYQKNIPAAAMRYFSKSNCKIPQAQTEQIDKKAGSPNNIIHGEFAKAGQTDWAILCSDSERRSRILIFWGGDTKCDATLAVSRDKDYLQGAGGDKIAFSHQISVEIKKSFMKRIKNYPIEERPKFEILHDAIEDMFLGKASTLYYCLNGKWEDILGAD